MSADLYCYSCGMAFPPGNLHHCGTTPGFLAGGTIMHAPPAPVVTDAMVEALRLEIEGLDLLTDEPRVAEGDGYVLRSDVFVAIDYALSAALAVPVTAPGSPEATNDDKPEVTNGPADA